MNYTTDIKGLLTSYYGMPVKVEVPIGGYRIKPGVMPVYMANASYGEFSDTKGTDGEPVDCYIGQFPDSNTVYILNQRSKDGGFDEHKVMLGFLSEEDAASVYTECTSFIPLSIVCCTAAQLSWWLKYGDKKKPATIESLPFDTDSENAMEQNLFDWEDPDIAAARALYDMRHTDADEQLLEAPVFDSVIEEIIYNEKGEMVVLDALVVPQVKLEKTAVTFGRVFNRCGDDSLQVAPEGVQISKPFKKNGTTNVAMVFELTDGQVITCFLHNPDKTPNQLKPDDNLIAWRWMLNKKDITILVAPENGKDQHINEIGRRTMKLASKNSKRFTEANAQRAKREENLRVTEERIAAKREILKQLTDQINSFKQIQQQAKDSEKTAPATEPASQDDKQFLQNIIAGTEDITAPDFDTRLEQIARIYEGSGNAEMEKLLVDAMNAYAEQTDALDKLSA